MICFGDKSHESLQNVMAIISIMGYKPFYAGHRLAAEPVIKRKNEETALWLNPTKPEAKRKKF
jgi:hypothetical protein